MTIRVTPRTPVTVSGTVRLQGMAHPLAGARIIFLSDGGVQLVNSDAESEEFEVVLPPETY